MYSSLMHENEKTAGMLFLAFWSQWDACSNCNAEEGRTVTQQCPPKQAAGHDGSVGTSKQILKTLWAKFLLAEQTYINV